MLALLLSMALAAELEVDVGHNVVTVRLDGKPMDFVSGSRVIRGRATGEHRVSVHSLLGRQLAFLDVDLPDEGTTRLRYQGRRLEGVDVAAPAPSVPPVIPPQAVVATLSDEQFYVPLRPHDGSEPVRALVDTGATELGLCRPLAAAAGFVATDRVRVVSGSHAIRYEERGVVPRIEVFGRGMTQVTTVAHESCEYALVGVNQIKQFNAVFRGGHLYVWAGEPLSHDSVSLTLNDTQVYEVLARAPSGTARLLVDTGMHTTAMWRGAAERLGAVDTGEERRIRVSGGIVTLPLHTVPLLTVAGRDFTDVDVLIVEERSEYADGNLGLNVLGALELRVSPAGAWLLDPEASDLVPPSR